MPRPNATGSAPRPGTPPREAVARLLELHGDRLHRMALRICPTEAEAEDMVQETMIAALDAWPRFRGESLPPGEICERCAALFDSLDLAFDACATLRDGAIPDRFRTRLDALLQERRPPP